jgi:adenosylhomocysteine nucleosidase
MSRIAIVAALHDELSAVLDLMPDEEPTRVAGRDFWCGRLHGHPVVAVLSRIGKVAAATTAATLITRFGVERILFTGVAGGLAPGVAVGDVVVADQFVQHDLDVSPLFPRYEIPGYGLAALPADTELTAVLRAAAATTLATIPQWLAAETIAAFGLQKPRLHTGLLVSGDRFVATSAESQALRAALPGALAVEMEGAAFAQVCHDFAVPFAAVRTVSDRADDSAHVDFLAFLRQVACRYSARMVATALEAL